MTLARLQRIAAPTSHKRVCHEVWAAIPTWPTRFHMFQKHLTTMPWECWRKINKTPASRTKQTEIGTRELHWQEVRDLQCVFPEGLTILTLTFKRFIIRTVYPSRATLTRYYSIWVYSNMTRILFPWREAYAVWTTSNTLLVSIQCTSPLKEFYGDLLKLHLVYNHAYMSQHSKY
jgi:hypothetical protein